MPPGVLGDCVSRSGTGAWGSGVPDGVGVRGPAGAGSLGAYSSSQSGYAMLGAALGEAGGGVALFGRSVSPANWAAVAWGAEDTAPGLFVHGNLAVTGTKSSAVKTKKGLTLLYALGTPESLFEDVGTTRLQNGRARVELHETLAETIVPSSVGIAVASTN